MVCANIETCTTPVLGTSNLCIENKVSFFLGELFSLFSLLFSTFFCSFFSFFLLIITNDIYLTHTKTQNTMSKIELHNEDCMELMKRYPDNYFELAIVDPPYGINVNHNMGRRKGDKPSDYKVAYWDNESPSWEYFNHLFRISKNQIIWGANHFISKFRKDSSCWLMWDKKFSDSVSFAQFELAWTSLSGTCKKFEMSPQDPDRIHPTQKPVALYKWLLKNYAKEGDKILDTHGGSMSIAIACHDLGFDLILSELDKEYFEAGKKRLDNHRAQFSLFEPNELTIHHSK